MPVATPAVVTLETITETADSAAVAAAETEPEMIEVWRPGRPEGRRRPQGKHRQAGRSFARRGDTPQPDAAAASSAQETAPIASSEAQSGEQIPAAGPAASAEQNIAGEPSKPERHSRHPRRHGGDQRPDRPRRERDRSPAHAVRHERQERHERREKAPDPNSPFAKLAALKAQLEAEAKERR